MLLRLLFLPGLLLAQSDLGFPGYTAASIANAAANVSGLYAPNTLISIYGTNLSFGTQAITAADVRGGNLPTTLGSTLVRVLLNGQFANLYYASPFQVNALIPPHLLAGRVTLTLEVGGRAGPPIPLMLEESAPALFEEADHFVIASGPAVAGEVIVLYATGLGPTTPQNLPNRIPNAAAKLTNTNFQVWLNDVPVPRASILYAGITPGFAGLYQINLQLPADTPPNAEIRVGTPDRMSPPGRYLH